MYSPGDTPPDHTPPQVKRRFHTLPPGEPWQPSPSRHFGAVGMVPWTFRQTLLGGAVMLIPWFAFLLTSAAAGSGAGLTHPLSRSADATGGVVAFLFTAIVEGAFLLIPLYYVTNRREPGMTVRDGLRALGLRRVSPLLALAVFVIGLATILVVSAAYSAFLTTFHIPLQVNTDVILRQAHYAPLTTIGELAGTVLVAPFCEEVFFRGFLFAGLLRGFELWPALLLSAFLFALAHGDLGSFIVLFTIGCVLAGVRWRAGSLWPSIAIHTANNLLAALSVFLVIAR